MEPQGMNLLHLVLNILIVLVGVRIWIRMRKNLKGFNRVENDGVLNYAMLFDKLFKLTKDNPEFDVKVPADLFYIACQEKGFGFSRERCDSDHLRWIKSGYSNESVPNYLEAFLDDGKQYIIDA